MNGKEANKGWFAIVVEENQLEDLKELGSFEGGEKGITLKWDFVEILQHEPGGAEIFKQVINELCMPFIREALKASVNGKAFGKIKKMKPCHIFTARYHDEKPSYLLTVGKESKVPEKQNRFITRFIDENGNYWNDILESSRWKTKYKQQNHKDLLTQEDIGSFLMLCLDTYQTEPDNIVRLAERLPTSPETIKSQTLAWSIACYLVIAGKIPEAAAHMQRVEKNFMKKEFTNISYSYLHLKNFFVCMSEKKKNYQSIAENWKNAQKQHPDLFGFIRRL
ncbi:hypothetical protein LEP1GSC038_2330 [Leptospira weilii str. 2006001855]|uniref:Uncharacterized protein n=1 Tax=Leptospira weilii str. 2006001855 TaxID=996804 RepID=M6FM28_9LEPT|nr:hypothetical protein LEP1GSC038_2330 [Leptospira weilii str. 2006001855]